MNYLRTAVLLAGLTALFMAVGALIGGRQGMMLALLFAAGTNLFAYWNADRMVLSMYGAQEVEEAAAPDLYAIVRELAQRAGLPMPKIYIIDNPQPNAFATGRNPEHAAVAASTGLLQLLSHDEVAGVLAHELAHIKHRDTLTMTVTATIAGAISMLANFGLFFSGSRNSNSPFGGFSGLLIALLAPVAAMLVQMAISRSREYEADREGGQIVGHPLWLASALSRLEGAAQHIENEDAERNPATAHLFIVNPLSGARMDNLFSTHPSTANRIEALQGLDAEMGGRGGPGRATARRSAVPPTSGPAPGGPAPGGPWGSGGSQPPHGPWG